MENSSYILLILALIYSFFFGKSIGKKQSDKEILNDVKKSQDINSLSDDTIKRMHDPYE